MRARLVCVGLGGLLAMLAAARAHADWRVVPGMNEPPNHVLDVWGVGTYSVGYDNGSNGGAHLFLDGGVARTVSPRKSVGTFYHPARDCFVSLSPDGYRSTKGADGGLCAGFSANDQISYSPSTSNELFLRMKHAPGGGSAGVVSGGNDYQLEVVSNDNLDTLGMNLTLVSRDDIRPLQPPPYGVARANGGVHFFAGLPTSNGNPNARWGSINPFVDMPWSFNDSLAGQVQAVEPFTADALPVPLMVVGTRGALLQGSPSPLARRPFEVVERLAVGEQLVGLSMNVGNGSDAGEGFGMALVLQPGGTLRVMGPVPADSQSDAGTVWRTRELAPNAGQAMGDVRQVACHGSAYCVFTAPGRTTNNLFVYTNEHRPELSLDGGTGVQVDAGGDAGWMELPERAGALLSLGAVDRDGDPLRITARLENLRPDLWDAGLLPPAAGEPVRVPASTRQVCVPTLVGRFEVRASDGWRAHDLQRDVDVYLGHSTPPQPASVQRADGSQVPLNGGLAGTLNAGGAELTLSAVGPTSDNCAWRSHVWSPASPTGPSVTQDGGTASIRPLDTLCEAGGRDFNFRLDSTDVGGLQASRTVTVHQRPWGAPEPVFGPSLLATPMGEPVKVVPDSRQHVCQDTPGFPGVVTSWSVTLPDGSAPGSNYSIKSLDGGSELQGFPVKAPGLELRALNCLKDGALWVRAMHQVDGPEGGTNPLGPPSQRLFQLPPGWSALSEGLLEASPTTTPGELNVTSDVDCASERRLSAELWLTPEPSGSGMRTWTVTPPELWTPPRDVACGSYTLWARLRDDTGPAPEAQRVRTLELSGQGVSLEASDGAGLKAECGAGVKVALSDLVRPAAGFCQSPEYTWSQDKGPELVLNTAPGIPSTLATVSQDLDGLIGEEVEGRVGASKGGERTALTVKTRISTEPFIQVERSTELPAASETGLVGVLVRLTSTSDCAVREVEYTETLEGLSFVEDSARLDGVALTASKLDDGLSVTLPLLEARATRTLSYVARPHLLGERRMTGKASKKTIQLSRSDTAEPPASPPGCGCGSSAGAAPMLLVLSLLGGGARRRRRARDGARDTTDRS